MEIERLKEFCHLADSLSFAETSRYFFMSQSVLSKHIASMEDELGAKLFSRDSHHVRLTEKGAMFREDAEAVIAQYNQALFHLRAAGESYASSIKIGYMRNAARPFVSRFAKSMLENHPEVHVEMRCMEYGDVMYALSTGSIDMALAIDVNREVAEHHVSYPIYRDHFMAVVGLDHPLAERDSVAIDDLTGYKILLPNPETYTRMSAFIEKLVPLERVSEFPMHYQDLDTLFMLIEAAGYVGFSSEHNMPQFANRAKFLTVENETTDYNVSAIVPTGKTNPATGACLEVLAECRDALTDLFAKRAAKGLPKFD